MKRKQGDGVPLAGRDSSTQRAKQAGAGMLAVTMCCMDGTFEVTVKRNALIDELTNTIAESRGIANASRAVALFVAGEEEPLAGTQSVADRMTDAGANELFMLLRDCNDKKVLEDIYNDNDGANWEELENWMTDAPISEWDGVTADTDGNVTELDLSHNYNITTLPGSIGKLLRLRKLDLTYCSELGELPESLGELAGLQNLVLQGCSALDMVPEAIGESIGRLTNLQNLDLACTKITSLPKSLGGLLALKELVLFDCFSLQELPDSVGCLANLQNLNLDGCSELENKAGINAMMESKVPGCTVIGWEDSEETEDEGGEDDKDSHQDAVAS
jgi:Leucine-rich repeat (LRR) protein